VTHRSQTPVSAALVGVVALTLFVAACGDEKTPQPLSDAVLNNLAYPLDLGIGLQNPRSIQLKDGQFSETNPGGFGTTTVRLLDQRARGQIDEDKSEDAAVIFAYNGGGSGTFLNLVAVLNKSAGPSVAASTLLGDRVVIHSVEIVDRRVVLKMRVHGPQDPLCCPTVETTVRFALKANTIEEVPD